MRLVERNGVTPWSPKTYLVYDGTKLVSKCNLNTGLKYLLKNRSFDNLAFLYYKGMHGVGWQQEIHKAATELYGFNLAVDVVKAIKKLAYGTES